MTKHNLRNADDSDAICYKLFSSAMAFLCGIIQRFNTDTAGTPELIGQDNPIFLTLLAYRSAGSGSFTYIIIKK